MTPIERMARAIAEAVAQSQFLDSTREDWENDEDTPVSFREYIAGTHLGPALADEIIAQAAGVAARAALEAIREPDAGMLASGERALVGKSNDHWGRAETAWTAMIDAALSDQGEG